ncbi:MAG: hypothetical protein K9L02_08300 [Acholeplasmataceae bacterium]|nr:hypothetical protein [Acholeplasmataceae bacterium]
MKTLYLNTDDQIQEILNQYPDHERLEIHLAPGRYYQKLTINHNHLKLIGSNFETTVIEYDDYSYKMHNDGLLYNTFRTSTLSILSDDVELQDLTIQNTSGSGSTIGQAVALSIYGNHTRIVSCRLLGHQDTLFIGPLPIDLVERYDQFLPDSQRRIEETLSIFSKCIIEGDVDFIFGSGTALFDRCQIIALNKGYICAPSTYVSFSYGLIFNECDIISRSKENDVYLARPWRTFGSTVFYNCRFIGLFHQDRYDNWDKKYFRFFEYPYVQSSLANPLDELMIKHINSLLLSIKQL